MNLTENVPRKNAYYLFGFSAAIISLKSPISKAIAHLQVAKHYKYRFNTLRRLKKSHEFFRFRNGYTVAPFVVFVTVVPLYPFILYAMI